MFKKRSEIKKAHDYLQLYGPYYIFYIKKTKSSLEHTQARLAPQLLGNLPFSYAHYSEISLTNYAAMGKSLNFWASISSFVKRD